MSEPTILLLDDDVSFRALMRPALTALGLQVVEASKGRDALAVMTRTDFDLAIVDGLLPDTSGVKWIERVRASGAKLPIVFVSAFYRDLESYKRLTQELDVAEVMHKPLEPETLAAAVERRLPPRTRRKRRRSLDLESDAIEGLLGDGDGEQELSSDVIFVPIDDEDDVASEEAALRRSYENVLPHILDLFLRSARRLKEKPELGAVAEETLRQAHDIAGTAGSYGFIEIGRAGAIIEREVRRLREEKDVDWDAWDGAIDTIVRSPHAEISRPSDPMLVGELEVEVDLSESSDQTSLDDVLENDPTQPDAPVATTQPQRPARKRKRKRKRSLPSSAVPATTSVLLGPRLLVADDDPALVDYVASALEGTLVTLATATDVGELEGLGALDAAIVGLPFGVPDRSAEAIARLKKGRQAMPVALFGLEDTWEARRHAAATGADLYLAHPLDDRELHRAVHMLESLRSSRLRVITWDAVDCAGDLGRAGLLVTQHDDVEALLEGLRRDRPDAVVVGGPEAVSVAAAIRMTEGGEDVALLAVDAPPDVVERGADALLDDRSRWGTIVTAHARRAGARRRRGADHRTGLPHRSDLIAALQSKLAEALRHDRSFAVAALEIDGYAGLEHREGAALARRVLSGAAKLAAARFRIEDVRGLWSKGVLVCGFADTNATKIAPAVRRLQQEIASLAFPGREGRVRATASAGIASAPEVGEDLRSLVLVAEGRLRLAQKTGDQGLVWTG